MEFDNRWFSNPLRALAADGESVPKPVYGSFHDFGNPSLSGKAPTVRCIAPVPAIADAALNLIVGRNPGCEFSQPLPVHFVSGHRGGCSGV